MESKEITGMRFDADKVKHHLISPNATNELAKVLTFGAKKYADHNWTKGMKWSRVIASLKRHLNAIERGEDFDPETGLLHSAHVMCNSMFLTDYYKIYPQGDDRFNTHLTKPKIGLDIDDVLGDWVGTWCKYWKMDTPDHWMFDKDINEKFYQLRDNKEFWMSIPRKIDPKDLQFEPHCYITSRSIPIEWTQEWLNKCGFPQVPLYCVPFNVSKVDVATKSGLDIFIDDRYSNYEELNKAGICTYLFDAPHNKRYNVGYKRIYNLLELPFNV